jgi:hypothetical protein
MTDVHVTPVTRGLGALRVLIAINALAILAQALLAGMFLGGDEAMRNVHGIGAFVVHGAGLLLLIVAVLYWRPGRGSGFPALASLVLLLAGLVQSMTGGSGATSVHVPLGMAMFGLTVWLGVWSLRR